MRTQNKAGTTNRCFMIMGEAIRAMQPVKGSADPSRVRGLHCKDCFGGTPKVRAGVAHNLHPRAISGERELLACGKSSAEFKKRCKPVSASCRDSQASSLCSPETRPKCGTGRAFERLPHTNAGPKDSVIPSESRGIPVTLPLSLRTGIAGLQNRG